MPDILLLKNVKAECQDSITREGCSIVVRDGSCVQLDADGEALEDGRKIVEIIQSLAPMDPAAFNMLVAKHGPILS